jgi:hypothetical protein
MSECGGFAAAAPGVPNIQPVKPATKKKTMSAIVATAKLRSARRDRSHPFVDSLAFILICSRVSVSDRSDNAHAPSPTRLPIFSAPASSTPWVNPIWPADRGSVCMSKSSRIWLSIFAKAPPLACLPFRCHSQTEWLRLVRARGCGTFSPSRARMTSARIAESLTSHPAVCPRWRWKVVAREGTRPTRVAITEWKAEAFDSTAVRRPSSALAAHGEKRGPRLGTLPRRPSAAFWGYNTNPGRAPIDGIS